MKRAFSLILAVIMTCSLLSVSAMAAVEDYPQEFRTGKTVVATYDTGLLLVLQEDRSLWAMGKITMLGKNGPYDRKITFEDDDSFLEYHAEVPKKIAEDVAAFDGDGRSLSILKTDGTLWFADAYMGSNAGMVKKLDHVIDMSNAGATHILALQEDGTLWTWGSGALGALGIGDKVPDSAEYDAWGDYYTEQPIKVMEGVKQAEAGFGFSVVLKEDGSVWCWGYNNYNQAGTVTSRQQKTPVKILDDAKKVYAGLQYSIAIKNDNSLWAWGKYLDYVLGNKDSQPL